MHLELGHPRSEFNDRPGRPNIVWVLWERLSEPSATEIFNFHHQTSFNQIPRKVEDTEYEWIMFSASIVNVAVIRSDEAAWMNSTN